MDRGPNKRRLPSHGTLIAYTALFLALCGSGYAATQIGGGVKVTCSATRAHKRVSCRVVGVASRGPQGPQGPTGPRGPKGDTGTGGSGGPTVFTQEPAYSRDGSQPHNFLTAVGSTTPDPYFEGELTYAEDRAVDDDVQNDLYVPLESPSRIAGGVAHISSVQFCINIGTNTNSSYAGQASVSLDKATVYELSEPKPAGGQGSGNSAGPPPYSTRVTLLQQTYMSQTQIDDCPTISAATPPAVNPDGYLVLALTVGLTTSGQDAGTQFGTVPIQLGRVTTTYTP
jgi:hypothetical protein